MELVVLGLGILIGFLAYYVLGMWVFKVIALNIQRTEDEGLCSVCGEVHEGQKKV